METTGRAKASGSLPARARSGAAILLLSLLCVMAGASASVAQRPAIEGLDSLSSATLHRALEYLQIQPAELGFDKLYAEDDTFRLGIVEDLLGDPLRIPGWQSRTLAEIRTALDDPAALARALGAVGEAGSRAASEDPRPAATAQTPAMVARPAAPGLEAFLQSCRDADRALQRAFARLSAAEKDRLLIYAPAMWGNTEDDPLDRARKGELHIECGVPADTSGKVTEDLILDLAVKIDRAALTEAAATFLAALAAYVPAACSAPLLPAGTERGAVMGAGSAPHATPGAKLDGVTGGILAVHETPWGLLVIGGEGANVYAPEALARIAFLIEPGGDDVYRGRAASAVGGLLRPLSAVVDLAGDDFYDAGERSYALGGALLGVAALIDHAGEDVYRAGDGSQGAGCFGAGLLYDGGGVDTFRGRNLCQGAGAFGLGALVSAASATAPPGPELQEDRAFALGFTRVPGTGAVPIRYDDNDVYECARMSQGFASTFGMGLLCDRAGNDTYRSGGHYLHAPLLPHDFQSLSQGYSIGYRPRAAGGIGILMDESGNDFYAAEVYAQGVSYWYSIGLLYDGAGNDRYLATQYAQGAGVHLSVGSLWDRGGDDHYVAKLGVTQGTSHDLSAGWLIDEGGNDYYLVSDGQAISITNSATIFVDAQGNDFYATPGGGQGKVTWARGFCGAAIFLDLEGRDTYSPGSPGADGGIWAQDLNSLGIDLDRDIELPGESLPEVVLTAADSLRTIEELFATASIWEVGSAREKVRRARAALATRGIPALDYAVAEKLGTHDGLEYRAIEELGKVYPDSLAARLIAHLDDHDEWTLRNVIGLLGGLKHRPAAATLVRMLGDRRQEKHWVRIIGALGEIGAAETRAAVRPFLRDAQERRRIFASAALAALKDTSSVAALIEGLADPLLTVRAASSAALRSFGPAAVAPLAARLAQDPPQRGALARTLGAMTVALRDSTAAPCREARALARRALMAELDRGAGVLAGSASAAALARAAAVDALVRLGDAPTLDFVDLHMQDESDPLVRRTYEIARRQQEER